MKCRERHCKHSMHCLRPLSNVHETTEEPGTTPGTGSPTLATLDPFSQQPVKTRRPLLFVLTHFPNQTTHLSHPLSTMPRSRRHLKPLVYPDLDWSFPCPPRRRPGSHAPPPFDSWKDGERTFSAANGALEAWEKAATSGSWKDIDGICFKLAIFDKVDSL